MIASTRTGWRNGRSRRMLRHVLAGAICAVPSMAIAATDPAAADGPSKFPIACGDDQMTNQTTDGTVVIRTSGEGGSVTWVTRGPNGEISLEQSGPCNDAEIRQTGSGNISTTRQHGSGNRVVVRQGPLAGDRK